MRRRVVKNFGLVEKRRSDWPLDADPTMPAPYDKADWAAVRALAEGRADAYQQRLVLDWLVYISGKNENPFRTGAADGMRATDFALGKAWMGHQIAKLLNMTLISQQESEQG